MAKTLKTERERLEDELIRIDRTIALDRQKLNRLKANIDALTDERLRLESKLSALRKGPA
jgi:chromosome segregation ATPase